MSVGTFIIRPTSLLSGGTPFVSAIPNRYAGWVDNLGTRPSILIPITLITANPGDGAYFIIEIDNLDPPIFYNASARFGFVGLSIYLDGSLTPIDFSGLPSGFTPLSASVKMVCGGITLGNTTNFTQYQLQQAFGVDGPVNDTNSFGNDFPYPSPVPTILNLISNGCGVHVIGEADLFGAGSQIDNMYNLRVEGTYTIVASSSPITIQNSNIPVTIGDKVKIIIDPTTLDPTVPPPDLTTVTKIELKYIDPDTGIEQTIIIDSTTNPYNIIVQQKYVIWIYVPIGFPIFKTTKVVITDITLVFEGKQFTGSILVGTLPILLEDSSGIYTLVKGQTHDIIYSRDGYITGSGIIMLPDMLEDEVYPDSFFSLLSYPYKILAENDSDEDNQQGDFSMIGISTIPILIQSVEIPSPFIKTAFLP